MRWEPLFRLLSVDPNWLVKMRRLLGSNFSAIRSFYYELVSMQEG
jgi:hypothetical protein